MPYRHRTMCMRIMHPLSLLAFIHALTIERLSFAHDMDDEFPIDGDAIAIALNSPV